MVTDREKRMLKTIAQLVNDKPGHHAGKRSIADSMMSDFQNNEDIPAMDYINMRLELDDQLQKQT